MTPNVTLTLWPETYGWKVLVRKAGSHTYCGAHAFRPAKGRRLWRVGVDHRLVARVRGEHNAIIATVRAADPPRTLDDDW